MNLSSIKILLSFANIAPEIEDEEDYLEALLEEEVNIRKELDELRNNGFCTLEGGRDFSQENFFDSFRTYRDQINIIHFSGHAAPKAILLRETLSGRLKTVNIEGVADMLRTQSNINLVFLNGCSTKEQAKCLIEAGVKAVIVTTCDVYQYDAEKVATQFYKSLSKGASIEVALSDAKAFLLAEDETFNFCYELVSSDDGKQWVPFNLENYIKDANLYEKDIRDIIILFDEEIEDLVKTVEQTNEVFKYLEKEEKNKINSLREEYFSMMQNHSLPEFRKIEIFLQNPDNKKYLHKYLDVTSDLNAKIAIERQEFTFFDELLENLILDLTKRNLEALGTKRRKVRILFHYMYWHCDIGKIALR